MVSIVYTQIFQRFKGECTTFSHPVVKHGRAFTLRPDVTYVPVSQDVTRSGRDLRMCGRHLEFIHTSK